MVRRRVAKRLGAAVAVAAIIGAPAAASAKPIVRASASAKTLGPRIPNSFWGYSFEYENVLQNLGSPQLGVNTALVGLFRDIAARGGGPPVLRFGGGSQDLAWWNPTHAPSTPDLRFNIDEPFLTSVRQFLDASGSKLVFGLNLANGNPQLAADEVRAVDALLGPGRVAGYELGNEPDFYPDRIHFKAPDGSIVYSRPRSYGPREHGLEFDRAHAAVAATGTRVPIGGPSTQATPYMKRLPAFVKARASRLGLLTTHDYPLTACKDVVKQLPHAGILVEDGVITGAANRARRFTRLGRLYGIPVRITEANSVSCGGLHQVSDVFASTLWSLDYAYTMALTGIEGINFHASPAFYRPFTAGHFNGWGVTPAPMLYAHLAFSEAAPAGSRLLPEAIFGQQKAKDSLVRTWSTLDPDRRTVRTFVLYKAGTRDGEAIIKVPGGRSAGTLKFLDAPSPLSDYAGVKWAGQQLPVLSRDGRLRGPYESRRLRRKDGAFRWTMRPYTAALLTVRLAKPVPRLPPSRPGG
ncbi:hypothetical protein [Conexibacter sp. SYSU D00693]|uniref:hypothetical protein n=1 Tax=Conexibacter sp. SYSU D00693 TaxID=2812560 RepID=UPI00196A999B|nr:hypothetical protein [Conexibacter sp. SYSU D00693]